MNIIIAGNGIVGSTLTRLLSAEGHNVTLIDSDPQALESGLSSYDILTVQGNCASMGVLLEAGIKDADLLIAATDADEINLLCCSTAHGLRSDVHTIARIRNPEYTEQIFALRDVFGLSLAINPEKQGALEIERLIKFPGFLKRDSFAKGRTEIVELRIDADSKLCNAVLTEVNSIVKCKVLICAVLRSGEAITPGGNFVLKEGDRIFVTAPTENLTTLLRNLGIISRPARRVILCGGGRIGYYLAEALSKAGISVEIIEKSSKRCRELAALLPKVTVINGDSTDQELLESEGLSEADAVVSLAGQDELNLIISLYAKSRGVPQVITELKRMENRGIVDALSLGSAVCPKELCSNTIARYVRAMGNQRGTAVSVHSIADGKAEAVEFLVEEDTPYCDVPLRDIPLKSGVLVVSITRGARTEIPGGLSGYRKGDTLVVVTSGDTTIRQLDDIFA